MINENNSNSQTNSHEESLDRAEPKKTKDSMDRKKPKVSLDFVSAVIGASLAALVAFLLTTFAEPALTHKSLEENVRITSWKTGNTLSIFVENDSSDTLDIVKFNLHMPFTRASLAAAMIPDQVYSIPGDEKFEVTESADGKSYIASGTTAHSISATEREIIEFALSFDKTIELSSDISVTLIDTQENEFHANEK